MNVSTRLADPRQLRLKCITTSEKTITLIVTTIQPRARCPRCHYPWTRVHSRYVRTVADLPWLGIAVRLALHTRRCFCEHPPCAQPIFCERSTAKHTLPTNSARCLDNSLYDLSGHYCKDHCEASFTLCL